MERRMALEVSKLSGPLVEGHAIQLLSNLHGRRLHDNITSNPTFKWTMIAIGCTVGVVLLVGLGYLIYYCVKKKKDNKVQPGPESKVEGEVVPPVPPLGQTLAQQENQNQKQQLTLINPNQSPPVAHPIQQYQQSVPLNTQQQQQQMVPLQPAISQSPMHDSQLMRAPLGGIPQPPWQQTGAMPPGIMLAQQIPITFQPYASNPRPSGAPPYERLVLISSRVNDPLKLASAVLPNVAVIVYDWKTFTFQELVRYIKQVLGSAKVATIAIIAPGNKPGSVALLEGSTTTPEKLAEKGEILQFWKVLSGCVSATASNDGRRIDLLGCRVVESPREGAVLLRDLWAVTAVPFAAADDALGGYMLATFLEDTSSKVLSLVSSTIKGLDLYFNRNQMAGLQPASYAAPLPVGSPPVGALAGDSKVESAMVGPVTAAYQQQQGDVFKRFTDRVATLGYALPDVFKQYDVDKSGQLTQKQVIGMLQSILPDASSLDVQHFQAMMDVDKNNLISQKEFIDALQDNKEVHVKVRAGKDENALLQQLHEYLTDNESILSEYFRQADKDNSGQLDHAEVCNLVQCIPALEPDEQKFIIGYIYQNDKNGDGLLSFEELKGVIASFGSKLSTVGQPSQPAPLPITTPAPQAPGPAYATVPQAPAPGPAYATVPQAPSPGPAYAAVPQAPAPGPAYATVPQAPSPGPAYAAVPQAPAPGPAYAAVPQAPASGPAYATVPQAPSAGPAYAAVPQAPANVQSMQPM